jgi:hypothetical protein
MGLEILPFFLPKPPPFDALGEKCRWKSWNPFLFTRIWKKSKEDCIQSNAVIGLVSKPL